MADEVPEATYVHLVAGDSGTDAVRETLRLLGRDEDRRIGKMAIA